MSALIAILEAALATASVARAAEGVAAGLNALHAPGRAADAVAAACSALSQDLPDAEKWTCTSCGTDWRAMGCLCRLEGVPDPFDAAEREAVARDFSEREPGSRVRFEGATHVVEVCPDCNLPGVRRVTETKRRSAETGRKRTVEVTQWIHRTGVDGMICGGVS